MSRDGDHRELGLNHRDLEKLHGFGLFQVYTGVTKSIMQCIAFEHAQRSHLPEYSERVPAPGTRGLSKQDKCERADGPQGVKQGLVQYHKAHERQIWVA